MNRRRPPNEYIADAAMAYAESRRDLIEELNLDLPLAREQPGFYGAAIASCEQSIIELARALPGGKS